MTRPDRPIRACRPPPGQIPLTRNEIAALVIEPARGARHRLRWSAWRRCHQHRARACHYQRQARQEGGRQCVRGGRAPQQQRPDRVDGRGQRLVVGEGAQRAGHVAGQQEGAGGEREQDGKRDRRGPGSLSVLGGQSEQRGDPRDGETEQQQHAGGRRQGCHVGARAEADQVADAEHEGDDEHVAYRTLRLTPTSST